MAHERLHRGASYAVTEIRRQGGVSSRARGACYRPGPASPTPIRVNLLRGAEARR